MSAGWGGRLLAAASFWLAASAAHAADAELVATAKWQKKGDKLTVVIALSGALTQKQRDMIDGGFTTLSQLSLKLATGAKDEDDNDLPVFYGVRCSVKFDAWEEVYDVARLDDERPRAGTVKTFGDYGEMCLKAELEKPELVDKLAARGGTIFAKLVVKQTSTEEAEKIKDWLIQQQSGVMQSLFSHMLGELTLNQTASVRVSVPPKPEVVERVQAPDDAKRKG